MQTNISPQPPVHPTQVPHTPLPQTPPTPRSTPPNRQPTPAHHTLPHHTPAQPTPRATCGVICQAPELITVLGQLLLDLLVLKFEHRGLLLGLGRRNIPFISHISFIPQHTHPHPHHELTKQHTHLPHLMHPCRTSTAQPYQSEPHTVNPCRAASPPIELQIRARPTSSSFHSHTPTHHTQNTTPTLSTHSTIPQLSETPRLHELCQRLLHL